MKTNGGGRNGGGKGRHQQHFSSVAQEDIPQWRRGKHHEMVANILGDIENIADGRAVKVPRDGLGYTVQQVRSALSRGARKRNFLVATAADDNYLYVWRKENSR
jgi:hypothetical protein